MIIDLAESMECTSTFLKQVRDYQTSNSTNYTFEAEGMTVLQQVSVRDRINTLNATYSQCIQTNEGTQQWFSSLTDS